jgi:uncharacterized protein YutE (UPF0331/DUF86 family)
MDQVLHEKAQSIERCIAPVRAYYLGHEADFRTDFMRQDAIVLTLERACQQAIDMGNRMLRMRRLPIPKEAADVFRVLGGAGLLDKSLTSSMVAMTGFRNVAVHAYRELDLDKVQEIIEHRLDDLLAFSGAMLRADPSP